MRKPEFDIESIWETTPNNFFEQCKKVFEFQSTFNPVYKQWVNLYRKEQGSLQMVDQIPFLPISFFKSHDVFMEGERPSVLFESSGTTEDVVSKHWVADTTIYEHSFLKTFEMFYGQPSDYCIIGLLPSYLERNHSSLVYMVDRLIKESGHPNSGFYLYNFQEVSDLLKQLEGQAQKVWLIGVSFALIDFATEYPQKLWNTQVIETGGMKGRKEELSRPALHHLLSTQLGLKNVQSEYGMTELLSQAYALEDGIFKCPPWMKVLVTDPEDPTILKLSGRGVLNIIDLANIYSCSFITTQDMGEVFLDGSFSVIGRVEASDRRGCSLLVV